MRRKIRHVTWDEISLGNKLPNVRKQLNTLARSTFNNPITAIALQQGIGKTHMFIEYARRHWRNEKIIFASPRHDHLNEIMGKLGRNRARHWYGFSYVDGYGTYRGCRELNNTRRPLVSRLIEGGEEYRRFMSPKILCPLLCDHRTCRYYQQFRESNKIDLIPMEYLRTTQLTNQNPHIVFIDESIDKIIQYRYDSSIISNCLAIAQRHDYREMENNLTALIPRPENRTIQIDQINEIETDKDNLMIDCISNEEFDDAMNLSHLNSVLNYLKLSPDYNKDYYYHPMIYDAFNLTFQHGVQVVFLNASFNKDLFKYLLETHPNQRGDITLPIYTSQITNQNSIIIRPYPKYKFSKSSFIGRGKKKNLDRAFDIIKRLENNGIPKQKIGIITYIENKYRSKGKEIPSQIEYKFKNKGYETLHFWGESGLNILEDKLALIVMGTPIFSTSDFIKSWEKIHNEETDLEDRDIGWRRSIWGISTKDAGKHEELIRGPYEILDTYAGLAGGEWKYHITSIVLRDVHDILTRWGYAKMKNYRKFWRICRRYILNEFSRREPEEYDFLPIKMICTNQHLDSIHRCRPLTHDRVIIALGDVPTRVPETKIERELRLQEQANGKYSIPKDSNDTINSFLGIKYVEIEESEESGDLEGFNEIIINHNITKNSQIMKMIDYIIDNREHMNNRDIAKALHLRNENRNPDVALIKKIKKEIEIINKELS